MPFRPYHRFQNWRTLERVVSTLHNAGNVPEELHENFHRYDSSMIHKLRSAKYNVDRLSEKLTTTDIQDAADTRGDFMFEVNMFIDGFFYTADSSLDILARVVLTLFGQALSGKIYFETAHTNLERNRPGDPLLPRLDRPPWRRQFSDYRNALTHELILAPRCEIVIDNTGAMPRRSIVFPLADDPRADRATRSYRRHPNVLAYVSQHFTRILRIANTVYGDLATRAEANGALPI